MVGRSLVLDVQLEDGSVEELPCGLVRLQELGDPGPGVIGMEVWMKCGMKSGESWGNGCLFFFVVVVVFLGLGFQISRGWPCRRWKDGAIMESGTRWGPQL